MTNTATEVLSVVIEREIPYPPEKIWRALTQPHLIEEWLMKNDFKPAVGHRFNLRGGWGGVLDCEVLAVEPNRTLSYTWNFAHDDAAYNLKSVVNFTLTPTSTGTHLRVEQSGFRPDQKQVFGGAKAGWQQFFAKLEQVLARADWHTSKPGTLYRVAQRGHLWVNAMANKTSIKSTKVAKKAAAKRVAAKTAKPRKTARESQSRKVARPPLLAGGNPQIAKADGDAPVQAYIAAMPGWKRDVGRRLDALIARTVPGVRKAVKWNSPLYGIEGQGWFLGVHCFTKYVKVAFFRGTSLRPPLPGASKHKEVRYLDIHEDDPLDEAQLAAWVKQASQLPGERM